jgi:hypothetical protein
MYIVIFEESFKNDTLMGGTVIQNEHGLAVILESITARSNLRYKDILCPIFKDILIDISFPLGIHFNLFRCIPASREEIIIELLTGDDKTGAQEATVCEDAGDKSYPFPCPGNGISDY